MLSNVAVLPAPQSEAPAGRTDRASAAVIITCFNHGRFLAAAIDSVLAQTAPAAEIIVVDDGSTDNTEEVARLYAEIRYIRQDNAGLSAARNMGLRAAASDFVAFLDADDLLLPQALEKGLDTFAARPDCAFVYGGHLGVDERRAPLWEVRAQAEEASYRALLAANVIGMHATVLYRRCLLTDAGGFDEGLRACEDYDVYLRLARRHPIACHSGVIAEYRQHDANMSRDPERMLTTALAVLKAQQPHAVDPEHAGALARGLVFYQRSYGLPLIVQALKGLADPGRREEARRHLALAARTAPRAFPPAAAALARAAVRRLERRLPTGFRRVMRKASGKLLIPPVGEVSFGDLRRTAPIDPDFGFGRGLPVDRHYIEAFLHSRAADISGRVLEVGDNAYTMLFGGSRVRQSDILHVSDANPLATFVGDLTDAEHIPSDAFDCVVLTQTLHLIFDMPRAVATLHRILKPGGVLLLTVPGISQIDRGEWGESWYWALTPAAVRRLLAGGWSGLEVESHGNVLSATAFLQGLSAQELTPTELGTKDPAYPVIVTARAVKAGPA